MQYNLVKKKKKTTCDGLLVLSRVHTVQFITVLYNRLFEQDPY